MKKEREKDVKKEKKRKQTAERWGKTRGESEWKDNQRVEEEKKQAKERRLSKKSL